jgi:hypothetical protein
MAHRKFRYGKYDKNWHAKLQYKGQALYLGSFPTKEEAVAAEDAFRLKKGMTKKIGACKKEAEHLIGEDAVDILYRHDLRIVKK